MPGHGGEISNDSRIGSTLPPPNLDPPDSDSHNGNISILRLSPLNLAQKGTTPNNVQSSDTKQSLGVEHAVLLQDLGENGYGGVDGVADDQDHR